MEQFSLEKWLQDKSRKIRTRDGRAVRILCTDAKAKDGCCIIAAIETDGEEEGYQFFKDGTAYSSKSSIEDCADLFFADEKNELTEFDYAVLSIISDHNSHTDSIEAFAKRSSKKLLDLARKQLESNYYDMGKQDALKDLPKLEKTKDVIDPTIPVMYTNSASMKSYVEYNGYKLCINDVFEKLSKEEQQ